MTSTDDWPDALGQPEDAADDWALAPEGTPGDDPFDSPWLAEPGAFLDVGELEPGTEWADAVDEIDYADEADPFALPEAVTVGSDDTVEDPLGGSDPFGEANDPGWDYWSPTDADPGMADG